MFTAVGHSELKIVEALGEIRGGLAKLVVQLARSTAIPNFLPVQSASACNLVVAKHHVTPSKPPMVIPEHTAHPVDHSSTTVQNDFRSDQPARPPRCFS